MPALTGFSLTKFPSDILYDAGVIYHGPTPFGVTEGAPRFDPGGSFEPVTHDGQYAVAKGLYRQMHGVPVISFTMKELGDSTTGNQLAKLEPGSTSAGTTPITVTPAKAGTLVAAGSYVTDFRVIWERGAAGSGLYFAVYFPVALYRKYGIQGQNKKEAQIPVEVVGCLDMATQAINDPAYKLEYRTALPT